MKKIFTCILAAMLAMPLFAKGLLTESFNRNTGQLSIGDYYNNSDFTNDTTDWWYTTSTKTYIQVDTTALTYTGYCDVAVGNAAKFNGSTNKDMRQLSSSISSGSVYMSFLLNVTSLKNSTSKDYFISFLSNVSSPSTAGNNIAQVKILNNYSDGTFQLGIGKANETLYRMCSQKLNTNQTYLIVVCYTFVSGTNNDVASLWINPGAKDSTSPKLVCVQDSMNTWTPPQNKGASTVADASVIKGVYLKPGTNTPTNLYIDEIKVATTWADLGISDGDEPIVKPELGVSTNSLDFGKYVSGQSYTKTFTVTAANLTEDISIGFKSSLSNITVSPTTIAKDNADLATGVTVIVTVEEDKQYDFTGTVVVKSGDLTENVSISGTEQVITYKNVASFASLLEETETDDVIYTYTGTEAKILSVGEEYKQITLKDASNNSVKVQLSDAQWETINPVNGMKVTQFVFTAEILFGGTQAICTPITLTFAAPNFTREITNTDLATICLKGDVSNFAKLQEQATFYKILCKQEYQGEVYNIVLEEVNTNMEAGKPYIFQPKAPCTMEFYYSATTDFAGSENGLIGTFTNIESAVDNILVGKYLISNNMFCKAGEYCSLAANRAYIDIDQVPAEENAAPKVGMRHINLQNADARQLPTNLNETQTHNSVRKAIINGQFVILHNNKAFNAIGAEIQ